MADRMAKQSETYLKLLKTKDVPPKDPDPIPEAFALRITSQEIETTSGKPK